MNDFTTQFLEEILPVDFDISLLRHEKHAYRYGGIRRDVVHFLFAEKMPGGENVLTQHHIPRFILAEAIYGFEQLNAYHKSSEGTQRIASARALPFDLISSGCGSYSIRFNEIELKIPYSLWNDDVEAYRKAKDLVVEKEGGFCYPNNKTPNGNPVCAQSSRLIEAIAFERVISNILDETWFGIYSAFCS